MQKSHAGSKCSVGGATHHDCARFSFAYYPEERLVEGVGRFAKLVAHARSGSAASS